MILAVHKIQTHEAVNERHLILHRAVFPEQNDDPSCVM